MKGPGFDRLRIAGVSAGAALASLFGAVTRTARASTALPVTYNSSTRWQAQSSNCADRFGLPGKTCGLGVRQFEQVNVTTLPTTYVPPPTTFNPPPTTFVPPTTTAPAPTTSPPPPPTTSNPPSTTSPAPSDGDGAMRLRAKLRPKDLSEIAAFNNSLGVSVGAHVFRAPRGRVTVSGDILTAGPVMLNGVATRVQYRFFGPARTVRAVFTFQNTSTTPIDLDVRTDIGGFGGSADIALGSNDSGHLGPGTRWYETAAATDGSWIPSVLFVGADTNGAAALQSIARVTFANGVDDYVNRYHFKLGAGGTTAIMVFAQANSSEQSAAAIEATYANLYTLDAAGLLADLPVPRQRLLNWNKPLRPRPLPNAPLQPVN